MYFDNPHQINYTDFIRLQMGKVTLMMKRSWFCILYHEHNGMQSLTRGGNDYAGQKGIGFTEHADYEGALFCLFVFGYGGLLQ